MAYQPIINTPLGGGDSLKDGSDKVNENFVELYALAAQAVNLLAFPNEATVAVSTPTYNAAGLQTGAGPYLAKIFGRRVNVSSNINASKIAIYPVAIGGSGGLQMKFALYSSDGATKVADWPWIAGLFAGTVATSTLGAPVAVAPGEYLLCYAGMVWNTKTATIRSQVVTVNDWSPQLTAVATRLGCFHATETISVVDSSSPTVLETFPASITLAYTGGTFDDQFPQLVITSA